MCVLGTNFIQNCLVEKKSLSASWGATFLMKKVDQCYWTSSIYNKYISLVHIFNIVEVEASVSDLQKKMFQRTYIARLRKTQQLWFLHVSYLCGKRTFWNRCNIFYCNIKN
jgi:hypothetical protein